MNALVSFAFIAFALFVPLMGTTEPTQNQNTHDFSGTCRDFTEEENNENDYRREQCWYLGNTAVSMNISSAWRAGYTGKGVLVAVVDDGVETNHPDLKSSFDKSASHDFLSDIRKRPRSKSSHGTLCAGIIVGQNNSDCGVGFAFGAKFSSLRIYDDDIRSTDETESKALSFQRNEIDIYSNSWGPGDMGWEVKGPGPKTKEALLSGAKLGRLGKGSIFVFAAGNGGISGDSCAFSGYVNNIHTIGISSVLWDGSVPAFTEQCAAIMAVTYGQDMFTNDLKPPLISTEGENGCTNRFSGTSASTAMASGIIALALQANANLTWRDVQHLIVRSSTPIRAPQGRFDRRRVVASWTINGAQLPVSSHFGFGLMNAGRMVAYAKNWISVPEQLSCDVSYSGKKGIPAKGPRQLILSVNNTVGKCSDIRFLEHVQVEINLEFSPRGSLEMSAESPNKTSSKLLYPRPIDRLTRYKNLTNWTVTSLHYWGENPSGDWKINIRNTKPVWSSREGKLFSLRLILYGTREDPLKLNSQVSSEKKDIGEVNIKERKNEIPVHGGFSRWSAWSWCSATCGKGSRTRSRLCNNPRPANGGRYCVGKKRDSVECRARPCPRDGGYSKWGRWSRCSVTCGNGTQQRTRACANPAPAHGGRHCRQFGPASVTKACSMPACPTDNLAGSSSWSTWSKCNVSCGEGWQTRNKSCDNSSTENGERNCSGNILLETKRCSTRPCSVEIQMRSGFSSWGGWSECSGSCGQGWRVRYRSCRGRDCTGRTVEYQRCERRACPIGGGYSRWSRWSRCSVTCGKGTQQRTRICTNPAPARGGRRCWRLGRASETKTCKKTACPTEFCENSAGEERCTEWYEGGYCYIAAVKQYCKKTCGLCGPDGGYSTWSRWSRCSVTCGKGTQQRTRICTNPAPAQGEGHCSQFGPASENKACSMPACPTGRDFTNLSICEGSPVPRCTLDKWLYAVRISAGYSTDDVQCKQNKGRNEKLCEEHSHLFDRAICLTVSCL